MDEDETEAGPAIPRPSTVSPEPPLAERTAAPANDYESQVVRRLEQELEQRGRAPVGTPATPPVRVASSSHRLSIAEELARLESAPIPRSRPRAVESDSRQPAPAPEAHSPHRVTASGVVDRDGDGNIDHWIYRVDGEIAREEFDDDADGRTDRALQYDLTTHQISRVEEDADRDGTFDTWTDYRNGAVVRRRADADDDGVVDTWSFYDGGEMTRHEQDVNGDGFRDRVSFFRGGQLVREERDLDGDGQRDVATHYDAARRITLVEEDTPGDGTFDVISHYDEGRLSRRELLGDAAEVN
jgi:hypothetical protein